MPTARNPPSFTAVTPGVPPIFDTRTVAVGVVGVGVASAGPNATPAGSPPVGTYPRIAQLLGPASWGLLRIAVAPLGVVTYTTSNPL